MKRISCALALALCASVQAQEYPTKPIRMVTQFVAGAGGDLLSRIVASSASPLLGQPVVVENRPGAGGALAAESVSRAAPDGYTILASTTNTQLMRVYLVRKSSFNPVTDFTPITRVGESFHLVLASPSGPATLKDLLDYARRNPGKVSFGTAGVGSVHHLAGEQLKMLTGVDLVHVPYKSTTQAVLDIVVGVLPMAFDIAGGAMAHVKAGKVRAIGIMGDTRYPQLPGVPLISDVVPGFQTPPSWSGIFAPAGLPPAVLKRLNSDIVKGLSSPESQSKADAIGFVLRTNSPEEFAALIQTQLAMVGKIVKAAKIEPLE
jgi:tripartite-type tricarboxylate transporter receptor subunit TctC